MTKKIKFCMVTTFYPPYHFGGDATYIYRLTNELAKRGHRVDVVHCIDAYKILESAEPKGQYDNHQNVKVYPLKSPVGFLSPLFTQQTGVPFFKRKVLKTLLENNGYDVIHYHNMSLIGITALSYGDAVKLYTTNEHWLICPMHVLWKFNREVCEKKECLACILNGKRPPQIWRYTRLLNIMLRHVDAFIAPSRFTMRKHLKQIPNLRIVNIPYFLPQNNYDHGCDVKINSAKNVRPYFLFVGRLEKIKGLQNLIPVFKKNPQYNLLIAGEGNYGDKLKAVAADALNIEFLGQIHLEKLQYLYRNAIALIVPSICYEVFGIIIIESFSMKTPVIVNKLGPMPEIIEDSNAGFVYKNTRELISAMEALSTNPKLRNELGNRGYQAYLKYWSENSHLTKYLNLIHKIQEKKNKLK